MIYLNKATLIGTLAQLPSVRTTKNGKQFATFKVSIQKKSYGDGGYITSEIEVTAFGKTCETLLNNHLATIGNQCLVECEISANPYRDKQGETRYTTNLTANWITFDEMTPRPANYEDDVPMF